jgi:mono/diheme cytochrome c family protein
MAFRFALFGIVFFVALAVLGYAYLALGIYDIGADAPHMDFTRAVIAYARDRSVAVRARDIAVPALDSPDRVTDGASDYDEMCTGCHLAPGMPENEMRPGLYPKPPRLAEIPALPPAAQFWIVKHGIKMSAMPAWGKTHSDDEIWNMVAFLQKLPHLNAHDYRALVERGGHHHMHDEHMEMH